jgi:hypothetical protein
MKISTIAFSTAIIIIISLLSFTAQTKSPLDRAYKDTIAQLKDHHHFNTDAEILEIYPELKNIQQEIQRSQFIELQIEQIIHASIPPKEQESKGLQIAIQNLNQKRKAIHQQLAEIQTKVLVQL